MLLLWNSSSYLIQPELELEFIIRHWVSCVDNYYWLTMTDYKRLRNKTWNFVFLSNAIRTLLFHKLLTTSEHTMNIEIISFYVSKECKNMQSLLQLSSVVVGLISELGQSDQTRENVGVGKAISM